MDYICHGCGLPKTGCVCNASLLELSNRVSVPAEFIEAVRDLFPEEGKEESFDDLLPQLNKVKSMLDQMKGTNK